MSTRTGVLVIAITLLAATAAFAQQAPSRSDDITPCAAAACERDGADRPSAAQGARTLMAEVVSIDEQAGRIVLDTELGEVTVPAAPAVIGQLSVGDVVMLHVVPDEDDAPAASPPTEDAPDGVRPPGARSL